jgi:hypothetical protein
MDAQTTSPADKDATSDIRTTAYRILPSDRVVGFLMGPKADVASWESLGETVEPLYTATQINELRRDDALELEDFRQKIESAVMAASETQPTHKHRCVQIMGALGYDYGDPDWLTPGELRRLDAALARVAELEALLQKKAIGQDEAARLLGVERELRLHVVTFEGSFDESAPWCVQSLAHRSIVSWHATRWDAIRVAAKAEAEEWDR